MRLLHPLVAGARLAESWMLHALTVLRLWFGAAEEFLFCRIIEQRSAFIQTGMTTNKSNPSKPANCSITSDAIITYMQPTEAR